MSGPRRKETGARCPICARAPDDRFKPFCSKRCADVDLARWLGGGYVIPGKQTGHDEAEAPVQPPESDE
jgi:endogenous inhibitor of DNA gyrase (YacG/DUF329 family)